MNHIIHYPKAHFLLRLPEGVDGLLEAVVVVLGALTQDVPGARGPGGLVHGQVLLTEAALVLPHAHTVTVGEGLQGAAHTTGGAVAPPGGVPGGGKPLWNKRDIMR